MSTQTSRYRIVVFTLWLCVWLLAACGGASAPAQDDAHTADGQTTAGQPVAVFADQQAEGIRGALSCASGQPATGVAAIDAYLVDVDGQPIEDATVTFDIDMTNMSHGQTLVTTTAAGDGHYTGDVHFSMAGPWRIVALVERPGQAPVPLRFDFRVQGP